jgi:hypothetical protein
MSYDAATKSYVVEGHNVNDLDTVTTSFIYIRIELFGLKTITQINHVNSVIINNTTKTVLLFDPQGDLKYDAELVTSLLNLPEYTIIGPKDIGYGTFDSLQQFDCFCQTYVLYSYILIIDNPTTPYKEYSRMFGTEITVKNLGYFLFYLYQELKQLELDIQLSDTAIRWRFPKSGINKTINTMRMLIDYSLAKSSPSTLEPLHYEEYDDFVVLE